MDKPCAFSGFARHNQPDSRPQLNRNGHALWPRTGGLAGVDRRRLCFVFPATVITGVLAWLYAQYGQLSQLNPFIYGIKPAVLAIILTAAITLGKKVLKTIELGGLALATVVACLLGINEIVALFAGGFLGVLLYFTTTKTHTMKGFLPLILLQAVPVPGDWLPIFWTFLRIGSLLYGGGYVLFAFLDAELVNQGLLTKQQLLDAVAGTIAQLVDRPRG